MKIVKKLLGVHKKTTPLLHEETKIAKKVQKAIKYLGKFETISIFCTEGAKKRVYKKLDILKDNNYLEGESQLNELVDDFYKEIENLNRAKKIAFDLLCQGFGGSTFPANIQEIANQISAEVKQIKIR